jgi:alkylation response protein AidB-like acyl-CoA dehydrogenase
MDFELDEEQVELQGAVRDVLARECPATLLRSVLAGGDDAGGLWKTFVGLDWPALTVPVDDGGLGLTAVELAITTEELGYVADPTPFLATTSQYLPLVRECATGQQRRRLVAGVAAGGTGAASFDAEVVEAYAEGEHWVLRGAVPFVVDADRADELAVVATTGLGPAVFIVPRTDADVTRSGAFDGTLHLAQVNLDGVRVEPDRVVIEPGVERGIARARQEALTAISAMTVGACRRILDLVLAHVKERHQFGVPIGRSRRSSTWPSTCTWPSSGPGRSTSSPRSPGRGRSRAAVAASMAKAAAGDAQRLACRHGIQLIGGLGFTWENDLQLFVRRAKAGELLLGGSAEHRARGGPLGPGRRDRGGPGDMKLRFDESAEAFRRELSDWLDANLPDEAVTVVRSQSSADVPEWARRWQRTMFDAGWLVPGNPPEYGGRNASLLEQFVHREELGRRRIQLSANPQGLNIIVPSLLAFGTDEQKRRWALPILRAEMTAALA